MAAPPSPAMERACRSCGRCATRQDHLPVSQTEGSSADAPGRVGGRLWSLALLQAAGASSNSQGEYKLQERAWGLPAFPDVTVSSTLGAYLTRPRRIAFLRMAASTPNTNPNDKPMPQPGRDSDIPALPARRFPRGHSQSRIFTRSWHTGGCRSQGRRQ